VAEGAYLALERSDQLSAGATLARGPLALEVDGWIRRMDDLAEIELDGSIGETEGRAHGLESRVRVSRGGLEGSLLYQYTRSNRREDPDDAWRPYPFDVPHRAELLLIGHLPRAVVASARLRASSGYPRQLVDGEFEPTAAYDLLRSSEIDLDLERDDPRLAAFHAVDLRLARTFSFRRWQLDASLDVQNVYSRRVVEPVITGFGDERPPYGFGLPFLPILGVEGRFWPGPTGSTPPRRR
jgi:hypothetical protein